MKFVNISLVATVMAAATTSWATASSDSISDVSTTSDTAVLILGAGATGLAAAYKLQQQGIDFLIVEAADRIGGRLKNLPFAGKTMQQGASWVQGTTGSWLFRLVEKANVEGRYTEWDSIDLPIADDEEKYVDYNEQWQDAKDRLNLTLECMYEEADMLETGESDISMRQVQKLCGWGIFQDKISEAVEWLKFDWEFADTPVTTSFTNNWPFTAYEIYGDEDYEITDSEGWLPIFDRFKIPSSKILLNSTVTQINYDKTGATVIATQTDGSTATELSFNAEYVICTFSLGVLQSDHNELFAPPLPDRYVRELFKFDMNTYTKIFMKFPDNFWGTEDEFFLYADERRGYYTAWQNMAVTFEDDSYNVLMVTVTGSEALRIAQQSDEETTAEAMEVLKVMFGNDIPDPSYIYMPRWNEDPLFRGSYSNWPIGTTEMDHVELGTPIKERLFLRGEGSSPTLNGWVHGGLTEGQQVAKEIRKCMDKPKSKFCKCANNPKCSTYQYN